MKICKKYRCEKKAQRSIQEIKITQIRFISMEKSMSEMRERKSLTMRNKILKLSKV